MRNERIKDQDSNSKRLTHRIVREAKPLDVNPLKTASTLLAGTHEKHRHGGLVPHFVDRAPVNDVA